MKRILNTLYITTQGTYLAKDGETVCVRFEGQTKLRLPIHTLSQIVCFGNVSCSPFLMGLCGKNNVLLSFLTEYGRFLARSHGPVSGNVLLRREQYKIAEYSDEAARIARPMILAKIANCRSVINRSLRDRPSCPGCDKLQQASQNLQTSIQSLKNQYNLDIIRGIEGESAATYFNVFDHLISSQKDSFKFTTRNRRPPLDNVNAMLSFAYTLLTNDVASALEAVGLDPASGFLHTLRPGRPSLALDLMEEFRAFIADRLVLSLINRQQVKPQGFITTESGAVTMCDTTRKTFLQAWQERKHNQLTHPFTGEKINIGLLIQIQAQLLARYIRGDIEAYPPFFLK